MEKTAGMPRTGRRVYQRSRGERTALGEREKRRLVQLGACLALFLVVFTARGADRLGTLRTGLSTVIRADADFRAAVTDLDWAAAAQRPLGETLGGLWTDLCLPESRTAPRRREGALYRGTAERLRREPALTGWKQAPAEEEPLRDPMEDSGAAPIPVPEPEPEVVHMDYTGPALPDNTTMDRYALKLAETVTPVMGVVSSGFGWREHPIDGGEKFHCGVDLAVDNGTPVRAFAAGTVDYIGESEIYGQYLQLRHDNGVTTFYAHCGKLCVQQGQEVAAGEKVAESGETGKVTGPHLHFELKKDGVRLEPLYYIETLG